MRNGQAGGEDLALEGRDIIVPDQRVIDRGRIVELHLIGDGPAIQAIRQQVDQAQLAPHVHFAGVLRDEALAQQVAACDCLVTASTIETQGLTKRFKKVTAVDGLDLSVRKGEILPVVFVDAPGDGYWREWIGYLSSHLRGRGMISEDCRPEEEEGRSAHSGR